MESDGAQFDTATRGEIDWWSAGLRRLWPAAATSATESRDNSDALCAANVLQLAEPRPGILKGCEKLAGG